MFVLFALMYILGIQFYCNDMEMAVTCKLVLYADDSILLVSDKDPKVIEQKLGQELKSTNNWLIENKLTSHPGKCEAILFGSKRKCKRISDFSITFNGTTIHGKSNIKYLGTIMDQNLTSQDNISGIVKKSNGKLKFLYPHKKHLNTPTRKILSNALIQGHTDYASVSWYHSASKTFQHKLQVIQNKMVRFILDKKPRDHIGQAELSSIGYLNTMDRVIQLSMNLTHDIFYDRCPSYMKTYFTKIKEVHSYNTRGSEFNFVVPKSNTVISGTFYYQAIKDWNALPIKLKCIENKDSFKRQLKLHLKYTAEQLETQSSVYY